jgi:Lrp/AsnC family transcriptional regulator, leucine-responsive regulatory protein
MKRVLDSQDQRILGELRENGRMSHSDLAERIHLSRNAVRRRVERLERDGVIRGYTILTDEHELFHRHAVTAVIFVHRVDRMRGADVIKKIKQIPEVVLCDVLSGELDLLVRIEADHAERLKEIWTLLANLPGVRDTVTSMVLG